MILLAFGNSAFVGYREKTETDSFSLKIVNELAYYRSQAMSESKDIELVYFEGYYQVKLSGVVTKQVQYPDKFRIDYARVGFKPSGTAKYAGSIIIYYRGRQVQKITVAPASGLISRRKI